MGMPQVVHPNQKSKIKNLKLINLKDEGPALKRSL
jgi:hypothetical protein